MRLKQDFDAEPLGAAPSQQPAPNPPEDLTLWTQQFLQASVVPRDTGGRWVRIQPKERYFARNNAGALLAHSATIQVAGAQIRGHMSLRLSGSGRVVIALRALQGPNNLEGSLLGGISIRNGLGSSGVGFLTGNDLSTTIDSKQWWGPASYGTHLANYTPGQTIELYWSIDQVARVLNVSVVPGAGRQESYPATTLKGVSNTPLQRLRLMIDAYDFNRGTSLFVDDLSIEEL